MYRCAACKGTSGTKRANHFSKLIHELNTLDIGWGDGVVQGAEDGDERGPDPVTQAQEQAQVQAQAQAQTSTDSNNSTARAVLPDESQQKKESMAVLSGRTCSAKSKKARASTDVAWARLAVATED